MKIPKILPAKKLIYLDNAATTPIDPSVLKTMQPFWSKSFGNPSSLYKLGVEANNALTTARKKIASTLSARPEEIIFTAGATESINLAIQGVVKATTIKNPHVIISAIEHEAVIEAAKATEAKLTILPVNSIGLIDIDKLKKAITKDTVLVSIMYANNEIGTIEPIHEISKLLRKINLERTAKKLTKIYFHTDASQAAGFLDLNVHKLGVDLLSLNGSKIYGPKQTGILYKSSDIKLKPIIYGGGQENNLRSGTENVAGFVGLAHALEAAQKNKESETKKQTTLRNFFVTQILKNIPAAKLNGPSIVGEESKYRMPNNVSVTFPTLEGEVLVIYLDSYNIAASTGSACTTSSDEPSHVLKAIGVTNKLSRNTVRFSLGKHTTKEELSYTIKVLVNLVKSLPSK